MKRFHPSIYRFLLGLVSLILSLGLLRSLYGQIFKKDAVFERTLKIAAENARNRELKLKLEEATSSAFIEKVAREKLGMVKEGDTVVLIDTSQTVISGNNSTDGVVISNWEAWLKLFF